LTGQERTYATRVPASTYPVGSLCTHRPSVR
jgi:hypothetical protein